VALGTLRNRKAVPALVAAFGREETKFEAAAALAKMPDVRALDAYLYGAGHLNPDLRGPCSEAIGKIGKEALPLVERRLAEGTLPPAAIAELQKVFAPARESPLHKARPPKVDPEAYVEYSLRAAGDPERGRKLFFDLKGLACVKCHRVGAEGGDLGPDLSAIGAQYPRRELAESVAFPSRKVREGYQQVVVRTKGGLIFSGAVKAETPEEITLQDAEGQRHVLRTAEIDQRKTSDLSLMPEGLHAGLSREDFASLVGYLESLKK
jgi:putative heme-binding domain-containing protein